MKSSPIHEGINNVFDCIFIIKEVVLCFLGFWLYCLKCLVLAFTYQTSVQHHVTGVTEI